MKLKNLVLKGGGEKGVGLEGVLQALAEADKLKEIENIAGTSVGAIGALLIGSGLPSKVIMDKIKNTDFAKLIYGKTLWDKIVTDLKAIPDLFSHGGLFKANKLEAWLEDIVESATGKRDCTLEEWQAICVQKQANHDTANDNIMKSLYIEAFCVNQGQNVVLSGFSPEYKHMPVAKAVRASMAVPGFFTFVEVYNKISGFMFKFVDGGARNNFPFNVFNHPPFNLAETFGVWLGNKDEINFVRDNKPMPPRRIDNLTQEIEAVLDGVIGQEALVVQGMSFKKNIIFVDTESIGTLDLNAQKTEPKVVEKVIKNGYDSTKFFLATHTHEASVKQDNRVDELNLNHLVIDEPSSMIGFQYNKSDDSNKTNRAHQLAQEAARPSQSFLGRLFGFG